MPLKQVSIELTPGPISGNALRAHWQDGIAIVILRPDDPPVKGRWNTIRAGDIDANGGSDHATYEWDRKHNHLYLKVTGTELDKGGNNTLLFLRNVTDFRIGEPDERQRTGFVSLHGRKHAVIWRVQMRVDTTPSQYQNSSGNPAAISDDDLRNASSARIHIKAAEANPKRKIPALTEAENFARLIENRNLQQEVFDEITRAHRLITTLK